MSLHSALAAVALLAGVPAPASGDTVISVERKPVNLDAFGRDVVWSARGATGGHRLRHFDGERVRTAPVPPNGLAFDPDLGPGRVVVYTRCRRTCSIHRLDLDTGQERRLRRVRPGRLVLPSVWGSRVVFVRIRGLHYRVFVSDAGGGRPREITGPASRRLLNESWVDDTEASATGSWFLRMSIARDCVTDATYSTRSELHVAVAGAPALVDTACNGEPVQILRGGLTGDETTVTTIAARGPRFEPVARRYGNDTTEEAALPVNYGDTATDVAYYVRGRGRRGKVVRSDPLAFAPAERQVP